MASFIQRFREAIQTDANLQRVSYSSKQAIYAIPQATVVYILDKAPIVQWLPKYNWRWLLNDVVAGLTVGVLLVPQGLAYAKIATIPVEVGLMSSWLPGLVYTIMGTSKDLSTGPTSILGLLTADIVDDMVAEGFKPQVTASAIAFMVGIYSLFLGLLKLGFLLDYISAPVLSGFISAAAIVIILGQVPSLLGLNNVRSGTAATLHDVFTMLGKSQWQTVLIGLSGIILLQGLQFIGKRLGKRNKVMWALSTGRAAIVLVLFTGISFAVNKDRPKKPLFAISNVKSTGILSPDIPDMALLQKVAGRAVAPLLAASLEHIAIGKAFASKNGYRVDESQELTYLGVTNFFNSWFGAMTVGGAMSRTAVNSDAGVKSPLNGIFTAGFVVLGIYKLSGALFWIPKATLAAIIVTAVYHLFGPVSVFYRYWRTSFADFVASMICFWVTLFVSAEQGIAFAVAFSVLWTMVKAAFAGVTTLNTSCAINGDKASSPFIGGHEELLLQEIPEDTKVFRFEDSILFPNAYRVKDQIMDTLQVFHSGIAHDNDIEDRNWSVARANRVKRLRIQEDVGANPSCIRIVVLDFGKVSMIDSTGLNALRDLRSEIKRFAGEQCELRFVDLNWSVKKRFERYGYVVRDERVMEMSKEESKSIGESRPAGGEPDMVVFENLVVAVSSRTRAGLDDEIGVEVYEKV